jgi:hypothetical protein
MHGVATGSVALSLNFDRQALLNPIVANCEAFAVGSTAALSSAVAGANLQFGGTPKFTFVALPFEDENAVFASHPLLWGLKLDLESEDEVVAARKPQCQAVFGDPGNILHLLKCQRASAGHPNVEGATVISRAIMQALT